MEKHKCNICFRKFSNGRALGGHVRSHMNLYPPQKPNFFQEQSEDDEEEEDQETESLPSSTSITSSESESESEEELQEDQQHGVGSNNGSVVLQTKRIRSSRISGSFKKDSIFMLPNCEKKVKSPLMEAEEQPLSSITENTSEEDAAYWLMLLSRDKWGKTVSFEDQEKTESFGGQEKTESFEGQESKKDEEEEEGGVVGAKVSRSRSKGKYRCETCEKVFKSYQALGGHRASHKRIKLSTLTFKEENNDKNKHNVVDQMVKKLHECPVCFKVFSSGQALGGHKRSHNTTTTTNTSSLNLSSNSSSSGNKVFSRSKNGETLIDLNLPAPMDDDDEDDVTDHFEQFSAVSHEDFVNPIKL